MYALSFRLSSWYSSGVFVLVVIILTLIYTVISDGVSPLIAALFSSGITLLISCNSNGYDGLSVVLGIKPGTYNLGGCGSNAYSLPTFFIAISLLS